MPRLRNELTGAVMTVEDSTAEQLSAEWVDADATDETPKRRGGRPRKADSDE